MPVVNCEMSIAERLFVEQADVSDNLPDGKLDNDFNCPFYGFVVLMVENGKIVCAGPGYNCSQNTTL